MKRLLPFLIALAASLAGCQGRQATPAPAASSGPALRTDVTFTDIRLGRAVDDGRRVAETRDVFAPADTVYVSVVMEGSGPRGVLKARWTNQGSELVAESSLDIVPSGTTVSEFHISRPGGLALGGYQVEIFFDGAATGKRSFSVHLRDGSRREEKP
jgi:hypothetical protein